MGTPARQQHGFYNQDPNSTCGSRLLAPIQTSLPQKRSRMAEACAGAGLACNDASPLSSTPGDSAGSCLVPAHNARCRSVPVPPSMPGGVKGCASRGGWGWAVLQAAGLAGNPACPATSWLSPAVPRACKAPRDLHDFYLSFCPSTDQHQTARLRLEGPEKHFTRPSSPQSTGLSS